MHRFVIEDNNKGGQECFYKGDGGELRGVKTPELFRFEPLNAEQKMAMLICLSSKYTVKALEGEVGTGKTFIAVMAGAHRMLNREFEQVIYTRPPAPVQYDMGFLPGDEDAKLNPWIGAFYDQLELIHDTRLKSLLQVRPDAVKALPIEKIKGRTLRNAFVIVDEGQDTLPNTIKMMIGRPGEGTEIVICGDRNQVDAPGCTPDYNGLIAVKLLDDQPDVAYISLTKPVRSRAAELSAMLGKRLRAQEPQVTSLGQLPGVWHGHAAPQIQFNMPMIDREGHNVNGD